MPPILEISLNPRRLGRTPVYRQIYVRIRDAISDERLRPGDRLPSTRGLANELGIARGTVEEAYALLDSEGYITRLGQAGSIVARDLSSVLTATANKARGNSPKSSKKDADQLIPFTSPAPFMLGRPAFDAFPAKLWARITASEARRLNESVMTYPNPLGYEPLRSAIAYYAGLARGIRCTAENVIVTNGYQGALFLLAHCLLKPRQKVWVENPGYFRAHQVMQASAAQLAPVPVDGQGLDVAAGVSSAPGAKMAVVTPSHHAPTCATLSLPRRMALLDWAHAKNAWIVEDDYDGEFHYAGRRLPALKSLDDRDRVIYAGSFSKTLYPGLRLGYVIVPDALLPQISTSVMLREAGQPTLQQAVTARFMREGYFARHLKKMRKLYASRRAALADALTQTFGDRLRIELEAGGMNIVARLPGHLSDRDIVSAARERNIVIQALSPAVIGPESCGNHNALLFGFANVPEERAVTLVRQLERVIGPLF